MFQIVCETARPAGHTVRPHGLGLERACVATVMPPTILAFSVVGALLTTSSPRQCLGRQPASITMVAPAASAAASTTDGSAISIKSFDVWAGSSPLVLDINWKIMPNERWALLGANGCGKSTLLRAITEVSNGEVFREDGDLVRRPPLAWFLASVPPCCPICLLHQ